MGATQRSQDGTEAQKGVRLTGSILDLGQNLLENLMCRLSRVQDRNSAALVCSEFRDAERCTRIELQLRCTRLLLVAVPSCFKNVRKLDLSRLLARRSYFAFSPLQLEALKAAFPEVSELVVHDDGCHDIAQLRHFASTWPSLKQVTVVGVSAAFPEQARSQGLSALSVEGPLVYTYLEGADWVTSWKPADSPMDRNHFHFLKEGCLGVDRQTLLELVAAKPEGLVKLRLHVSPDQCFSGICLADLPSLSDLSLFLNEEPVPLETILEDLLSPINDPKVLNLAVIFSIQSLPLNKSLRRSLKQLNISVGFPLSDQVFEELSKLEGLEVLRLCHMSRSIPKVWIALPAFHKLNTLELSSLNTALETSSSELHSLLDSLDKHAKSLTELVITCSILLVDGQPNVLGHFERLAGKLRKLTCNVVAMGNHGVLSLVGWPLLEELHITLHAANASQLLLDGHCSSLSSLHLIENTPIELKISPMTSTSLSKLVFIIEPVGGLQVGIPSWTSVLLATILSLHTSQQLTHLTMRSPNTWSSKEPRKLGITRRYTML
jgi:hypothetical protein